ncbi:LamG-like jellyroll fold domain-containing protein [Flavobacterium algicola]|uniref:LamG-like jellyroll fold domain-containing protein n=1 Tax=Flavobacterium algicola TaxID=556529 RepID=UPI001EFD0E8C|nr:LamG-like jellyroll fold domain-containing protein [Flavobacterium algicola]MCG9791663.1 T9SS type A sorting domain-containing protein [Flavobacterium algicola]
MKKKYLLSLFAVLITQLFIAQTTEDFETETNGSTSFTDNGQVFNVTTQAHGPFKIQTAYPRTGWNGTAIDNNYIENSSAGSYGPVEFTIATSGSTPFNLKSLWLYLSRKSFSDFNITGSCTITGKLAGATVFTASQSSGFATGIGTTNGFTSVNMTTYGGSDNSNAIIDSYIVTTTGNIEYVALDAMTWQKITCSAVTVAKASQTNIACNGGSTGAAAVNASGGTGLTYNWTPGNPTGDGTASVIGLTAGNWTCTVTNSCGNSNSTSFNISQPTAINLTAASLTNISCNSASNGAATVNTPTGGAGGYTYNWTPGNPAGDGTTSVTGLTAGSWTCTVTDANGCTKAQDFIITQPDALTAPTTSPVTYLKNATATPLTASGTGLLWYASLIGGIASTSAPTPSTTVSGTTTYYVSSSNSNGCESTRTALVVTVTSPATHLNFDGVNDYIRIPKPTTSDFTLEYWIKTTDTGSNSGQWYGGKGIVDAEEAGVTNDFGTSLVNSKLAFGVGNPDITIFSTTAINTGEWKHVCVSWKQATGQMKLYIDGNLEASGTGSTLTRNSTPEIVIGALQYNSNYFNGSIDELRIWNTVRTVEQINNSKNCELAGNEQGLISYYKFNQGNDQANNTAQNTLTNAVTGYTNPTLTNFALTGSTSNWLAGSVIQTGSTCATLSTTNFNKSNSIKVYPNPTSNFVIIEASTMDNATIQISDVSGRILVSKNISETANTIDLSPLQNGVYIFRIKTQDGESVTKVIKQ